MKKLLIFLLIYTGYNAPALKGQTVELVKDISPNAGGVIAGVNLSRNLVKYHNKVYFRGAGNIWSSLWQSDGTEAGTIRLEDDSLSVGMGPSELFVFQDELYFSGQTPGYGAELMKTDGTVAGTVVVKDIMPGTASSGPVIMCECAGKLYFKAASSSNGQPLGEELWATDGTEAGTYMVKDIRSVGSSFPRLGVCMDSTLYFSADDGTHGGELWRTQGIDTTTYLLFDINPNFNAGSNISLIGVLNDKILVYADDGIHGLEPWISDGNASSTFMLKDINMTGGSLAGISVGDVDHIVTLDDWAYFAAKADDTGTELWKTDGTSAGTQLVKDIADNPAAQSASPTYLTVFENNLYFNANTTAYGQELWRSDGSDKGTELVIDIQPGPAHGNPSLLKVVNEQLYFRANDGWHGSEFWRSDGSLAGTYMVADINPIDGSNPAYFQALGEGDTTVFVAFHHQYQQELWRLVASKQTPIEAMQAPQLSLFPNPTHVGWTLMLPNSQPTQWHLKLLDLQGQSLYQTVIFRGAGSAEAVWLDAQVLSLSPGAYVLQIQSPSDIFQRQLLYFPE